MLFIYFFHVRPVSACSVKITVVSGGYVVWMGSADQSGFLGQRSGEFGMAVEGYRRRCWSIGKDAVHANLLYAPWPHNQSAPESSRWIWLRLCLKSYCNISRPQVRRCLN